MSQSPTAADKSSAADYFRNWDALGLMIARGSSFSGNERNCVFLNIGGQRYADISAISRLDFLDDARAVAATDWDHDGDIDFWVSNRNAPRLRLLRNDLSHSNSFVAIRCESTFGNRDAVGARVEVIVPSEGQDLRLIDTVRAGTGFLTQSSKWIHFGVPKGSRAVQLRVRWPGSASWETFSNIAPGHRYRVHEGSGQAVSVSRSTRDLALQPSHPSLPDPPAEHRVVFSLRPPMPALAFDDFHGGAAKIPGGFQASPVLVNLWASWCQPCVQELQELAQRHDELKAAGLRIVALSTDELTRGTRARAKAVVEELGLPFESGLASAELVQSLGALRSRVLYRERPLPLPCSFLIDTQGRWAVYYAGRLDVDSLRRDVTLLDASRTTLDAEAFPATGRFVFRSTKISPIAVADAYLEAGYLADARRQLVEALEDLDTKPELADGRSRNSTRLEVLHRLVQVELQARQYDVVIGFAKRALELDPTAVPVRMSLSAAYHQLGDTARAKAELKRIVGTPPASADVWLAVGTTYVQLGELADAINCFEQGLQQDASRNVLRFALATALQQTGRTGDAIEHYQLLTRAEDTWALRALNNLAWLRATHSVPQYRDGAEAVRLASKACRLTNNGNARYLGTLGSAYAEAGQFPQAISTTNLALDRAKDDAELSRSLRERLALYRDGKPFHQSR